VIVFEQDQSAIRDRDHDSMLWPCLSIQPRTGEDQDEVCRLNRYFASSVRHALELAGWLPNANSFKRRGLGPRTVWLA
jgi:hypothetical protein